MKKDAGERSGLKARVSQYEYEIILFVFLSLRFVFKNILGYKKYFTDQPVFGLTDRISIIIGTVVLLAVCAYLALIFAQLIKRTESSLEKPVIYLIALFLACPVSLPFLFDTNSLSGTQMLYPFALFILSVLMINKLFVKWFIPLICALYFIPAVLTTEYFFTALRKGAMLYVPLILMFLFLDMMKIQIKPNSKKEKKTLNESNFSILFIISCVVSIGSYVYTIFRGKTYSEMLYAAQQKLDWYFLVCILIAAPALCGLCVVLYKAVKNSYPANICKVIAFVSLLLLPLSKNNYYGIWIPFLVMSLFIIIFYSIWQKNPAMLNAARDVGGYLSEHQFIFYIVLVVMASFSNVTSIYLSKFFQNIFSILPY